MPWLLGKKEEVNVAETVLPEADCDDNDDISNDFGNRKGNNEGDDKFSKEEVFCDDAEELSDESLVESSSVSEYGEDDDDDDDDDSLVVNLIESISSEDERCDDDVLKIEEKNDDVFDNSFDANDDNEDDDNEEETASSDQSPGYSEKGNGEDKPKHGSDQEVPTHREAANGLNNKEYNNSNSDNDDPVTSFWEKQSLLVLAAEHDRVDILKTLLKDENEDKETLLNSGIPPLHLAISFGSVNTAQSLLRMGADPSVRPNVDLVIEERKKQPEDSKVEIPNIRRFESITAWELAFGNSLFDEKASSHQSSTTWSFFGTTTPVDPNGTNSMKSTNAKNHIIKPVDMAPSKREGIRHAFTAEALRSLGSDEVERLEQLLRSGMPANIDIGGKDLYAWAVEMEALRCEEFLRPTEAAKYEEKVNGVNDNANDSTKSNDETKLAVTSNEDTYKGLTKHAEENNTSASFVVHRPNAEETIPQLRNRLVELESLSTALSICLDNLAEEVSVCHGLLLMGGGASALASHVRSLRDSKAQKLRELEDARFEYHDAQRELTDLVYSTGDIGKEIAENASSKFLAMWPPNINDRHSNLQPYVMQKNVDHGININDMQEEEKIKVEQINIKAQIAASESKNRKLRASIEDLSEENARNLKEVNHRGLEGGINLVRGLREEIRDLEYNLLECRSMRATCKAKIGMILSRVSNQGCSDKDTRGTVDSTSEVSKSDLENAPTMSDEIGDANESTDTDQCTDEDGTNEYVDIKFSQINTPSFEEVPKQNNSYSQADVSRETSEGKQKIGGQGNVQNIKVSTRIATGDSRAIAIVQPGNKGFFNVDLWEVLLRIIGLERAANRRSVEIATKTTSSSRPNVMII